MASHNGIVLLVEDDPNDAELVLRSFKKSNIANEIRHVRDGVEALDFLFGRGEHAGRDPLKMPAMVLLDLKMPRLGGLEVLEQLRADWRFKRLPVVILTSSKEESDLVKGYDLGANSYVQKPVDFQAFASCVAQLGLYWLVLNEPPPVLRPKP